MKTIVIDPAADDLAEKLKRILPTFELVAACSSGEQGWEAASKQQPDVVFLNLDLPDTSGMALMHRLVQLPLALIVCSTWSSYAQEALQAGVKGYLLLPLEDWDVKKHIADAVDNTISGTRKLLNQYH